LHELLADNFEGRKEEQTGARLRLLHNITDQTIKDYTGTDEKTYDSTQFDTEPWLEDRLVLFDRAYLSYRRFALIDENGGYFLTPLEDNANPLITEELREWCGDAIPLEDEQIHYVTDDLYRQYIDVEVEVEFDTNKKHVVEILLHAALLSLLVSRELLALLTEHAPDEICCTDSVTTSGTRRHRCLIDLSQRHRSIKDAKSYKKNL
jgi:IS4 transposase